MKNLDRIERYIDHEMDENELWEFERDLRNDPQLAEELALMQALSARAKRSSKLKLMDLMDNIRQEEEKKSRLVIFSKRALAYAASLLVLIAAGIGLWHYGGNVSNERVFLNYYQPEPVSFAVRSATMSSDQPVMQGLDLFEKKEYAAAIEFFNQSPDNPMGRLYGGLAHMELGDFDQAILDFNAILEQKDNLFTDQAAWYLSLCYLKTNRQKDLEQTLSSIASGRSIYKTKALKLMNELGIGEEK
jgi:tetratricopeptide (TPR) repeat protein